MLKGKKGGIETKEALSALLKKQFDEFKATLTENMHLLWADLQKYPELIDKKVLDKKFENFTKELEAKLGIINNIIEQLIAAEHAIASPRHL